LLDRKANANATANTTASATAGPFDKLRAGSSTAPFAQCANDFAQDDNCWVMSTATATTQQRQMQGQKQIPYGDDNKEKPMQRQGMR
jgi:hypothetical protein